MSPSAGIVCFGILVFWHALISIELTAEAVQHFVTQLWSWGLLRRPKPVTFSEARTVCLRETERAWIHLHMWCYSSTLLSITEPLDIFMPICCLESTQGRAPERLGGDVRPHRVCTTLKVQTKSFICQPISYLHIYVNMWTEAFQIVSGEDVHGQDFFFFFFTNPLILDLQNGRH